MVRFKTFRKALKHIEKIYITDIQEEKTFSFEKAIYNTKTREYIFFDADGDRGIDFVIHQYGISLIVRENTPDDEFVFLVNMKGDKQYRMKFIMEDGYSFFVADEYTKENIEAVIRSIPKYLCSLKSKRVKVMKSTRHEAFSMWNYDTDNEDSVITETFFIDDFDYEVKVLSGLPIIHFLDKRSDVSAKALGVEFIVGDENDKNGIVVGVGNGEYLLKIVD